MNSDSFKDEILRSISLSGSADGSTIKIIIANREQSKPLLNLSSGLPKIQTRLVGQFRLLLSQPESLSAMNPFEIRCCFCSRVISYPAWHYVVRYAVNHFHYFVCFNKDSYDKPTTKCYQRHS